MENKMEREAAPRKSQGAISRQQIVPATGRSKAAVIEPRERRGSERMLHGELDFRISDGLSGVLSALALPQCSTSICITSLVWWDTQQLDCLRVSWGWDPPTSLGRTATSLHHTMSQTQGYSQPRPTETFPPKPLLDPYP